jgi:hypothetical protein
MILAAAVSAGCHSAVADELERGADGLRSWPGKWQPVPEEKRGQATGDEVQLRAQPRAGCYAVAVELHGRSAQQLPAVVRDLEASLAGVTTAALVVTGTDDRRHARGPLRVGDARGEVIAVIDRDPEKQVRARAIGCTYLPREPEYCQRECEQLFAQLSSPEKP